MPIDDASPHPPRFVLAAHDEERFLAPGGEDRRRRFALLLGVALAAHALGLALFLHRDRAAPDLVAPPPEIPIEVVQEPPPPPPPPPPPEPPPKTPPSQTLDEKPATSAPRAPPKQAVDTTMREAETEAPRAAAPPQEGRVATKAAAPPSPTATAPASASDAKLEDDHTDAEALDKAKAEEGKTAEAARQLAGTADVPAYHFAAATPMSEFPAGQEDNRYFSVVFAKVMSKNRYRSSPAARRGLRGIVSVSFVVDYMGRVSAETVTKSSGERDLDAIAVTAVRAAAPYPPPPGSGSMQLIWQVEFGLP